MSAIAGKSSTLRVPLRDQKQRVYEVTLGHIAAFGEAHERISAAAGRSPKLLFCSGDEPNAFATAIKSGEVVGVTLGMVRAVSGDRDMAAAIMGHELAHHTHDHRSSTRVNEAVVGLLSIIAGVALESRIQNRTGVAGSGLGLDLAQMTGSLVSMKFSRDQEREADDSAFHLMVRAGYNPMGAVRVSDLLRQLGSASAGLFFDSHPGWEERGQRFRSMIAGNLEAQQIIARSEDSSGITTSRKPTNSDAIESDAISATYTTTDSQKSYSDGIAALRAKDFANAARHLRAAADASHAPAQAVMGYLYYSGQGSLPKDQIEAARLSRLAADQEFAPAQNLLANMYANGHGGLKKDLAEAMRYYKLAADQGDGTAQANLGHGYLIGAGGYPKDEAEALRLFQLSASQGNRMGQYNVGYMYVNGLGGLPKDDVKAVKYWRLAADRGLANAQNNLGFMYENGRGGLPKDEVEAARLYTLAMKQGHPRALINLNRLKK